MQATPLSECASAAKMSAVSGLQVVFLLAVWFSGTAVDACPLSFCTCTTVHSRSADRSSSIGRKVKCSAAAITSLDAIRPHQLPLDTVRLDLSGNKITEIDSGQLKHLTQLLRLDLSGNAITRIAGGAFAGLTNLKQLDLSGNQMVTVNGSIFAGLAKLEKLKLGKNKISLIAEGTFDALTNIKQIDLQSDYLMCNCHTKWLLEWAISNDVRISSNTVCAYPRPIKGMQLKKLDVDELHCRGPVEFPLFEVEPTSSQVVFAGDTLPLRCRVAVLDEATKIQWVRKDRVVKTNASDGVAVVQTFTHDRAIAVNTLLLHDLRVRHTGLWKCWVQTVGGNESLSVNLIVMSEGTKYCDGVVTTTNKGRFSWPKTVLGITVSLPCTTGPASSFKGKNPQASHVCNSSGQWDMLDVSRCQYVREATKVLEEFSKTHRNMSSGLKTAETLKTYLGNGSMLRDVMDVVFVARTVQRLSEVIKEEKKMGSVLVDIINTIMNRPRQLLERAQIQDRSTAKLLSAVETVPQVLPSMRTSEHKSGGQIAMEAFTVSSESFMGMTCSSKRTGNNTLTCSTGTNITQIAYNVHYSKDIKAGMQLPKSIFSTVRENVPRRYRIQFIMYQNANLFPILTNRSSKPAVSSNRQEVMSVVMASQITGLQLRNLTDPVLLLLHVPSATQDARAVHWNSTANDGLGEWQENGCHIADRVNSLFLVKCYHLSSFAIIHNVQPAVTFRVLHPAIYVGSILAVILVVSALVTYITCAKLMAMPKKQLHAFTNTWFCIILLILAYTIALPIGNTGHHMPCLVIAVAVHFLSLSTFFWILVSVSNVYKKLYKTVHPPVPSAEDELAGPVAVKPMLRFYLVGYGIALIVCGITVAVSVDNYTTPQYCFLTWQASLGAFYAPAGFVTVLVSLVSLRIYCLLGHMHSNSEADRHPDMDQLTDDGGGGDGCDQTCAEDEDDNCSVTSTTSTDTEHGPGKQLRGVLMVFVLYVATWGAAATVISRPLIHYLPFEELVCSLVYAALVIFLTLFILIFYCLLRRDARKGWNQFFCCDKPIDYSVDLQSNNSTNQINHYSTSAAETCHNNTVTPINLYNAEESQHDSSVVDVQRAGSFESGLTKLSQQRYGPIPVAKVSNVVATYTTGAPTECSLDSFGVPVWFYNSRQNGIAKKYFQKHNQRHFKQTYNNNIKVDNQQTHLVANLSNVEKNELAHQVYSVSDNVTMPPRPHDFDGASHVSQLSSNNTETDSSRCQRYPLKLNIPPPPQRQRRRRRQSQETKRWSQCSDKSRASHKRRSTDYDLPPPSTQLAKLTDFSSPERKSNSTTDYEKLANRVLEGMDPCASSGRDEPSQETCV